MKSRSNAPGNFRDALNGFGRSSRGSMVSGICSGIGESTRTPAWIWRLVFLGVSAYFGAGAIIYVVLSMILPERDEGT